jgi:ubiquinone/menaquinone biosynthesis C-methylase UbiE
MCNDYTTFEPRGIECGPIAGDVDVRRAVSRRPTAGDPLTERSLRVWSAGDYDRISAGFRQEARAFVGRLALTPDDEVLDLACGSGNLTIPAARTGARVTGLDLVPALLDAARAWAVREELAVWLDEGNVEQLPYPHASFDVVTSMFGLMFASRPDRVAEELARVTRPGGRLALANWTREGFVGQMLAAHSAYVTPPPGLPSPLMWGDEAVVRARLDARSWRVTTARRTLTFRYPLAPEHTANLFRSAYGPTVRTLEVLDERRRTQLSADLVYLWEKHQWPGTDTTVVDAEYLEVVAIRR